MSCCPKISKTFWERYAILLTALSSFVILEGLAISSIKDDSDYLRNVETLGCWEESLKFRDEDLPDFVSLNFSENSNYMAMSGIKRLNFVRECAKLTEDLGYSVFVINYEKDEIHSPSCLTGAHAAHLYTSYKTSMKMDCNGQLSTAKKTYLYSTIGIFSDLFTNGEINNRRFIISKKQFSNITSRKLKRPGTPQQLSKEKWKARNNMTIPSYLGQDSLTYRKSTMQQVTGQPVILSQDLNQQTPSFDPNSNIWNSNAKQARVSSSTITTNKEYSSHPISDYKNVPKQQQMAVGTNPNTLTASNIDKKKPLRSSTLQDRIGPWFDSLYSRPHEQGKEIDELMFFNDRPTNQTVNDNILRNPSFENILIENSLSGWICQGDSNDPKSGVISRYSFDHHGKGQFSGRCSKRVASWAGPGQYIGRFLKPGKNYKFTSWVRLETRKNENVKDKNVVEIWLRYRDRDSNKVHLKLLARTFQHVNDPSWENIIADFHVPKLSKRVQYVFLYLKGPSPDIDILIDDAKLAALPSVDDWKEISDAVIDKIRKRTVKIRMILPKSLYTSSDVAATRIQVKQKRHAFGFGAAAGSGPLLKNKKYQKFFLDNFEWSVLEDAQKWKKTEPEKGSLNYENADAMIKILENNNKTIRGHCIFWAVPEVQPEWLLNLPPREVREALERRLDDIVARYKGKLSHWDVNNEMLHGRFYMNRLQDPSIRQWMYHRVRELDPNVKLFLNDFDVVENSLLTKAYVDLAKDLLKQNVPIHGIGAQGHFTGLVDPFLLKDRLDLLMEANLPIWLTEVDIVEPDPHRRAKSLENIMRVGFSHPGVNGIILWCFWNENCWRGTDTGLVEGNDFKLTEAGKVYQNLRRQWTTNDELKPSNVIDNEGHYVFRGFHGDYDMFIYLPDGQTIMKKFTIKPGNIDLPLKVQVYEQSTEEETVL